MDDLLREMGKRISMRRKQLSLTQEELAEKAGLTSQTISTAETGSKALRPANIVKLCGAWKSVQTTCCLVRLPLWIMASCRRRFPNCRQHCTGIWKIS